MTKFVKGSCENFCPENECKLRIKEHLLHFYELKNGDKNIPGKMVKCFSRSAAGIKVPREKDLRTERCLQLTVEYLLKDIILDKRKPYNFAYDFIFDRLRAVRQEIVMQNFDAKQTYKLLEPMIIFLAYSLYRLCEESIDNFDAKICEQHLQECLKRVLCCYDELNNIEELKLIELRRRYFIESLYQIFNLGSIEALNRCITLPLEYRSEEPLLSVYKIAMCYHQSNFYRVLKGVVTLPHILCAIASMKMQVIRRKLYEILVSAYNNKQLTVPIEFVCRLLNYGHVQNLITDCKHYNLLITEDRKYVHFLKADFKFDAEIIKPKQEDFVEQKLKRIYLPDILLLKKL